MQRYYVQIEQLPEYLAASVISETILRLLFHDVDSVSRGITNTKSNYWLNSIQLKNREERDNF